MGAEHIRAALGRGAGAGGDAHGGRLSAPAIRLALLARLVFTGLAGWFVVSGVEHLSHAADLDAHYREAGLPPLARPVIGTLQLVCSLALLRPSSQRAAALVLAAVMLLALLNHVRMQDPLGAFAQPAILLGAGLLGVALAGQARPSGEVRQPVAGA